MGPIGYPEMVFIFILALLLFGPKKLPELGKTLGKAMTEFNRAKNDLKSTFDREMRDLERETQSIKEITNTSFHDQYNYDYSSYDTGTHEAEPYEHHALEAGSTTSIDAHHTEPVPALTGSVAAPEGTVASESFPHGTAPVAVTPSESVAPSSETVSHEAAGEISVKS